MATKEIIAISGLEVKFCLDEDDTNGQLTMFEVTVNAAAKVPVPHYHKDFDESIYGLEGTVTFKIDGKELEIGMGDSCFIPRGIVHGFENKTNSRVKFLAIVNPGILGPAYFKELAVIINAGGPPDMVKVKAVLQKHGLVPVMD
ncbi:cupin domain-containing protein [Mucilaginibacter sp.]|uniref:cupin domain-containing protein n=1 Tax=Mucilaginibacter sp. TaxID=1882438 RepID=UPI0026339853|nr:cupin domain-containing protein [Mucilaginibacter sp.]MDB4921409.1 cupin [Mucilaginibacter sp.]